MWRQRERPNEYGNSPEKTQQHKHTNEFLLCFCCLTTRSEQNKEWSNLAKSDKNSKNSPTWFILWISKSENRAFLSREKFAVFFCAFCSAGGFVPTFYLVTRFQAVHIAWERCIVFHNQACSRSSSKKRQKGETRVKNRRETEIKATNFRVWGRGKVLVEFGNWKKKSVKYFIFENSSRRSWGAIR